MAKNDRTWELLQEMNKKLDIHSESLATLKTEARFGREAVEEAEKIAKAARGDVAKLKLTLARWGGIAAGAIAAVEALFHLVK